MEEIKNLLKSPWTWLALIGVVVVAWWLFFRNAGSSSSTTANQGTAPGDTTVDPNTGLPVPVGALPGNTGSGTGAGATGSTGSGTGAGSSGSSGSTGSGTGTGSGSGVPGNGPPGSGKGAPPGTGVGSGHPSTTSTNNQQQSSSNGSNHPNTPASTKYYVGPLYEQHQKTSPYYYTDSHQELAFMPSVRARSASNSLAPNLAAPTIHQAF